MCIPTLSQLIGELEKKTQIFSIFKMGDKWEVKSGQDLVLYCVHAHDIDEAVATLLLKLNKS